MLTLPYLSLPRGGSLCRAHTYFGASPFPAPFVSLGELILKGFVVPLPTFSFIKTPPPLSPKLFSNHELRFPPLRWRLLWRLSSQL
jgi:hypothetical protein